MPGRHSCWSRHGHLVRYADMMSALSVHRSPGYTASSRIPHAAPAASFVQRLLSNGVGDLREGGNPNGRRQDYCEITTVELGAAMRQAVLQTNALVELIAPDPRLAVYEGGRGSTPLPVTRVVAHLPRFRMYAPQPRSAVSESPNGSFLFL